MKKTLVLVVDRDDDFGVKGKVNTPIIGINPCLEAANALGIADPEDSDLNALYAAISVCTELQEDGHDADVALICGDEDVGHRSDLALVEQLETVLDEVVPDSVVLVGDGAEDEYIYPIVSSRCRVDSVRKVFVKQAPGLEGSFYILTRMLSDPGKRKRFLAPLGLILMMIALVFIIPGYLVYLAEGRVSVIAGMSGAFTVFLVGLGILFYAYSVVTKMSDLKHYIQTHILNQSTRFISVIVAFALVFVAALWVYYESGDIYFSGWFAKLLYVVASMVWPVVLAIVIYIVGDIVETYQNSSVIGASNIFDVFTISSIGLVALGVLDVVMSYVMPDVDVGLGVVEIICGVLLSVTINFARSRYKAQMAVPAVADEVQ